MGSRRNAKATVAITEKKKKMFRNNFLKSILYNINYNFLIKQLYLEYSNSIEIEISSKKYFKNLIKTCKFI